MFNCP